MTLTCRLLGPQCPGRTPHSQDPAVRTMGTGYYFSPLLIYNYFTGQPVRKYKTIQFTTRIIDLWSCASHVSVAGCSMCYRCRTTQLYLKNSVNKKCGLTLGEGILALFLCRSFCSSAGGSRLKEKMFPSSPAVSANWSSWLQWMCHRCPY